MPQDLWHRTLGLSDLGLCSPIMIVKVPGALWTVTVIIFMAMYRLV